MLLISNRKHYDMKLKEYHTKKKEGIIIHSSAVEYLTYVATVGDTDSVETCYEEENT